MDKADWCRDKLQVQVNHLDMAATYPGIPGKEKRNLHALVHGHKNDDETVIQLITCWNNRKSKECRIPGSIFIDSRPAAQASWEKKGGVFILHKDTKTTLQQLVTLLQARRDACKDNKGDD